MPRRCLLLDLVDDPVLIARYRAWHAPGAVPEAVLRSLAAADVTGMEIYNLGDRLVMIMDTGPKFDPRTKAMADAADPDVVAWEAAMSVFQKSTTWAVTGEKWALADRIFSWPGAASESGDATV